MNVYNKGEVYLVDFQTENPVLIPVPCAQHPVHPVLLRKKQISICRG